MLFMIETIAKHPAEFQECALPWPWYTRELPISIINRRGTGKFQKCNCGAFLAASHVGAQYQNLPTLTGTRRSRSISASASRKIKHLDIYTSFIELGTSHVAELVRANHGDARAGLTRGLAVNLPNPSMLPPAAADSAAAAVDAAESSSVTEALASGMQRLGRILICRPAPLTETRWRTRDEAWTSSQP